MNLGLSNVKAAFHYRGLPPPAPRWKSGRYPRLLLSHPSLIISFPLPNTIPLFSILTLFQCRHCCLGPRLLPWSHHLFPWAVIFLNLNQSLSVTLCHPVVNRPFRDSQGPFKIKPKLNKRPLDDPIPAPLSSFLSYYSDQLTISASAILYSLKFLNGTRPHTCACLCKSCSPA